MGWEFEQADKFGSERAAEAYARANNLAPQDVHVSRKGDEVELNIRRSALERRNMRDNGEGRRDGWS